VLSSLEFNVDETEEDRWRRVIDIDLTSVFLGCKRALKEMLPRGAGRIINIASVAGLTGTGGGAAYIASQARRGRPHPANGSGVLEAGHHGQLRLSWADSHQPQK
jgi:hypothetical protein